MPTIKNITGEYRLFFYSFDCNEPKHVHVQRDKDVCKFWLEPIVLSRNHGFTSRELNDIRKSEATPEERAHYEITGVVRGYTGPTLTKISVPRGCCAARLRQEKTNPPKYKKVPAPYKAAGCQVGATCRSGEEVKS